MEQYFPFQLSTLPYGYRALLPECDANILRYHYDSYGAAAVNELNNLAARHRLTDRSLRQLIAEDINLPAAHLNRLKNAAGSVFNHRLFFEGIACKPGRPPANRLTEAIIAAYGSMDRFRRLFTEAAETLIGSGWIWLVAEGGRGIHIAVTGNNEVVPLDAVTPVLVLDMWEHAYLPLERFDKAAYVADWFDLIDWGVAESRFLSAAGSVG